LVYRYHSKRFRCLKWFKRWRFRTLGRNSN